MTRCYDHLLMRLDLSKIRTANEHVEHVLEPGLFPADSESFRVVAPVSLAFDVAKNKRHFRLSGSVRTMLELPCSRCLEPFTWPVDATFDLRYQPKPAGAGDGQSSEHEREIAEDDLSTAFYEHDEIDLGELIREQLYLSLPMKPLCRDDCQGLCSVCGTNLNRGTCTCSREWDDPRLAALKSLKSEMKSES